MIIAMIIAALQMEHTATLISRSPTMTSSRFLSSALLSFPHVIVYLNNGFHRHHCLYLCLYCYHHTIIFMINHHNHYRRLPLNIVRNQNPPQVLGGWRLGSDGSSQKGDAYFCGGGNATTVPDIYGEDILCRISLVRIFCAGYLW